MAEIKILPESAPLENKIYILKVILKIVFWLSAMLFPTILLHKHMRPSFEHSYWEIKSLGIRWRGPCMCQGRLWSAKRWECLVQIDFVNLDQTSGSLMPGGSLSAYLKHIGFGEKFPGSNNSHSRCSIKLKGWLLRNSSTKYMWPWAIAKGPRIKCSL